MQLKNQSNKQRETIAMLNARPNLWGIVLAGGEEERLKEFIRAHLGSEAPKQFCTFLGHRTKV